MNIFVFDDDLQASARYFFSHDKIRATNQIRESAQMLAIACDFFKLPIPLKVDGTPYSVKHHVNHPAVKWTCESWDNFAWHFGYFEEMALEYRRLAALKKSSNTRSISPSHYLISNSLLDWFVTRPEDHQSYLSFRATIPEGWKSEFFPFDDISHYDLRTLILETRMKFHESNLRSTKIKSFKSTYGLIEPIFLAKKEHLHSPIKISADWSVFAKYRAYLLNKQEDDRREAGKGGKRVRGFKRSRNGSEKFGEVELNLNLL